MPQPVKLSDALVLDARLHAEVFQRSIAGQIEFWARLGRIVEEQLDGRKVVELTRDRKAVPLSELISTMNGPEGQKRLKDYLKSLPFPHFDAHPDDAELLIRTEENGRRTVGRFVKREFVVDEAASLPEMNAQASASPELVNR